MIPDRLSRAMNDQIRYELESSYLYLSMASYFHSISLDGMAQWMRVQAHEEMIHAMKFFDHVIDRGGEVKLQDLSQGKTKWSNVQEAWQDAYKHEQFITSRINELTTIAREEKDYASEPILAWFSDEQIEEEATSEKIADEMEMVANDKSGILMLDRELGSRVFQASSPLDRAAYNTGT